MGIYVNEYLEKHPEEFQMVISGEYSFGTDEMEVIIKEALLQNKRFYLKHSNDKEILDFCTYKLISFRKKLPIPFPEE